MCSFAAAGGSDPGSILPARSEVPSSLLHQDPRLDRTLSCCFFKKVGVLEVIGVGSFGKGYAARDTDLDRADPGPGNGTRR
jgi:hypothetical protein